MMMSDDRYNRIFKWGKDSCDDQVSITQLEQDYYPLRDPGSMRKGEAAEALNGTSTHLIRRAKSS